LFFIAERLHLSVVAVERMSVREVRGWLAWFDEGSRAQAQAQPPDDAIDPKQLTKAQLRRMFHK
jgi:hypothetical protein